MSFRDIGAIVHEQEKKQEVKEMQAQQQYLSSQAYRLFLKGKSPVQVGIELNLRQPDVTTLYAEYCKLTQLENLSRIYEKLNGGIEPFLELYWLTKAAGMCVQHVNKVLAVANNDLPSVQIRYDNLKIEIDVQEGEKRNSTKQDRLDVLKEESERLFTSLEKMLVDEAIDQYVSKTSSSSLPLLSFDDKQQGENSSPS